MAASVAKRKFAVQTVFYRLRTLTHFQPTFHFYTPRKYQKTYGFLMFSGGIEVEHWLKMG